MNWFIITIIAYLLNAIVFIIDKHLITAKIKNATVYAFYVGFLGIFSLLLIPFGGLVFPSFFQLLISLLAGAIFILALIVFYNCLKREEASRVVPIVGGFVPIFTALLSFLFLHERWETKFLLAIILLILGGILISLRKPRIYRRTFKKFCHYLLAAFSFAVFYVLTKFVYLHQPFISGFIWERIGGFLTVLIFLFFPRIRNTIFTISKSIKKNTSFLFLSNQVLSALNFILINFAISLASVTIVNALQGIQFIFVLIIAVLIGKKHPEIVFEEVGSKIFIQKIIAILMISFGVALLFI
ncbi:EamA family transporter [bacterium]|nr:EamA family transporter [bacterium]